MTRKIWAALATLGTLLLMDITWLGVIAKPVYDAMLGTLLRPQPYWPAVILFYLFYAGIVLRYAVFASASLRDAAQRAAGMGLLAYGTYDLTNWAILRDWPGLIVPVDVVWGVVLTTCAAVVGRWVWCGKHHRQGVGGVACMLLLVCSMPQIASGTEMAPFGQKTVEVGGFQFVLAHRLQNGQPVYLHGATKLRYLGVLDVLSSAYYVGTQSAQVSAVEASHRRLEIAYHRAFSAEELATATRNGIADNIARDRYARLHPWIEAICASYRNIKPGDRYAIDDLGADGLSMYFNNQPILVVGDAELADAYFMIWLGKKPFHSGLREGLLAPLKKK